MAVQVDQVTGVGTVIKTGDYVDMVVGLTGDKFPVVTVNPADDSVTVVSGLNSTSVKLLLQGMQVLGTLLPPAARPPRPTTTAAARRPDGNPSQPGTTLNGQQQIVILAVDAQQAEVIKFAQLDGSITWCSARRTTSSTRSPASRSRRSPTRTTGIILKTLVDTYGVLPPEVVETVTPQ